MDHALLHQVPVTCKYLLHDFLGIALREPFLLLDVLVQVPMGAIFEDEVVEVWRLDDLVQAKDVLVD
jgi:hypothetical protein